MKNITVSVPCIASAFTLAFILPLSARIGDTPGVCASKYGEIIEASPDGGFVVFQKDGVRMSCSFTDGVCSAISYTLCPTGNVVLAETRKEARFTKDQANRLLNFNRGTATWIQESKDKYGQEQDGLYKSNDGKLQAYVSFVAVNIQTIEAYRARLAQVEVAAVDKTIRSFESGDEDTQAPVIRNIPEVPKEPDPLEESLKKMEKSNQEFKESMEKQKHETDKALASLDLIAKRVQKRAEMKDLLARYEGLKLELAAAKTPDAIKALKAKEAALTDEMNKAVKDYGVMDAEYKKLKPGGESPTGK